MNRPGEVAGLAEARRHLHDRPGAASPRCCRPASSRSSPTVTVGFYCVPVLGEPESA